MELFQDKAMITVRRIRIKAIIYPVLICLCICFFPIIQTGCGDNQEIGNTLPPFSSILVDKGLPKLDSQLSQLVDVAGRGDEASFVQQHNIDISNGAIRVIIECVSGQLEDAKKTAINNGAEIEAFYENMFQALVPVTNLKALSDAESILFVRLPQRPLPLKNTAN
jgi:hypothetical protein